VPEWMPIVVMVATLIIFNTAIIKLLQVAAAATVARSTVAS
jgi:hypothetical protein